jgi:hypothetical protein
MHGRRRAHAAAPIVDQPLSTGCGWPWAAWRRRTAKSGQTEQFESVADFKRVPEKRLWPLLAFLHQVDRLTELDGAGRMPRFFRNHLLGTKVVHDETSLAPFVDLFRRYRREWLDLAARGQSRQWLWADRLTPRKVVV